MTFTRPPPLEAHLRLDRVQQATLRNGRQPAIQCIGAVSPKTLAVLECREPDFLKDVVFTDPPAESRRKPGADELAQAGPAYRHGLS